MLCVRCVFVEGRGERARCRVVRLASQLLLLRLLPAIASIVGIQVSG